MRRPSKGPCSQELSGSLDIRERDQEASGSRGSCPALGRRTRCSYSWWWDVLKREDLLTLTQTDHTSRNWSPFTKKYSWVLVGGPWLVNSLHFSHWLAVRWARCILSWTIILVKTLIVSCIIFPVHNIAADYYVLDMRGHQELLDYT